MKKITVMMSIYNETVDEITEAVNSILNQTFKDFYFVIVIDNPKRKDVKEFLIAFNDSRMKIIINDKNIGLAMCMNLAANQTDTPYLARMDADDISELCRLEKQFEYISNNDYDLVFSQFIYINENGEFDGSYDNYYEEDSIKKELISTNIIHHPTVMMKRALFESVSGYRDFPCAQDYDLWFRLLEAGGKFHMIKEKLLKYRIREKSVTNEKRELQLATTNYIKRLYWHREKYGYDFYSKNNFWKYIENNNITKDSTEKLNAELYKADQYWRRGKHFLDRITRVKIMIMNKVYRTSFLDKRFPKYQYKKIKEQRITEDNL